MSASNCSSWMTDGFPAGMTILPPWETGNRIRRSCPEELLPSVKKSKKKDNSLIQVISPYYGNFEEKVVEEESEAILTSANEETEETIENIEESETTETVEDEEEKLPTVEDNLRNIANIVKEEQDQLKIIEERTGEFKLDFGANKDEEKTTLIDEIDDNMSLDELMSLYEKKFKD